ncbi:ATP-binding cassette domain-containing protein, partial [Vibrio alginolyticus]
AGYLSGGEQQMLAIGRALMARPKMILLDEPSMGLSPLLVKEVFNIINKINKEQGITMLLVEQNANFALQAADYGYIMESGKIVLDGSKHELLNNEDVKEFYLAELEPTLANNREGLAQFPITRKFNVPNQQQLKPPFGGLNSVAIGQMARVFQSPGPLYEAQTDEADFWRMGRAFHAAGFCAGDLVHNTLSYHFSPGGFIMDGGARACGCAVFPAGVGNTEAQIEAIKQLQPNGYTGTPSYLLTLLQKYQEKYNELPSFEKALVSGEAVTADMEQMFEEKGIAVFQAYASAELGLIAYQV